MQLILECESTRVIHKNMSTIEETLSEKIITNGDICSLNDGKLNGNKENITEDDIVNIGEEIKNTCVEDKNSALESTSPNVEENCTEEFETKEEVVNSEVNPTQNGLAVDNDQIEESQDDNIEEVPESVNPKNIQKDLQETEQIDVNDHDIVNIKDGSDFDDLEEAGSTINSTEEIREDNDKEQEIKDVVSIIEDTNNVITEVVNADISEDKRQDVVNISLCDSVEEKADGNIPKLETAQLSEVKHDANLEETKEVREDKNVINLNIEAEKEPVKDLTAEAEPVQDLGTEVELVQSLVEITNTVKENEINNIDIVKLNNQTEQTPTVVLKDMDMEVEEIKDDVIENKDDVPEKIQLNEKEEEPVAIEIDEEEVKEVVDVKTTETSRVVYINDCTAQKDEMDVEEIKDGVEETNLKTCDTSKLNNTSEESAPIELKDETDVEEIRDVDDIQNKKSECKSPQKITPTPITAAYKSEAPICKLSNTLDILSDDDDDEPASEELQNKSLPLQDKVPEPTEKQCINIEDDDDIMVIDDVNKIEESKTVETVDVDKNESAPSLIENTDLETGEVNVNQNDDLFSDTQGKVSKSTAQPTAAIDPNVEINIKEKAIETELEKMAPVTPLLPENFLKTAKKNIADMTRDELEEFCVLKIVESIVDRSNLGEIKTKLKNMAQSIEEYRKKAMMLTKQNRDLQVVLKSVQEEQKKMTDLPISPLKITRSVGMQVLMTDKTTARKKGPVAQSPNPTINTPNKPNLRSPAQNPRLQKQVGSNQTIPVPRLVPANTPALKSPSTVPQLTQINTPGKTASPTPNGIKNSQPVQKAAEKRQHNRIQSVTVDLTDDEPPTKVINKNSPTPPVRLVPPQNLMPPQRQQFSGTVNSPRKVYIPISGPQNQNIRPGQTIMLKSVQPGIRPRCTPPQVSRMPNNTVRMNRVTSGRHPAPLPDAMKQYQPPNWKALPPAPDLRLSKVENGIVISWKIEGYQEDSYEEIASYQLYAYQETSSPPSTALWKKIGDVKALPLPMACTLTQFMAGFKYYFAVRAVDVKSRLGPFSLPGSILLLNKL